LGVCFVFAAFIGWQINLLKYVTFHRCLMMQALFIEFSEIGLPANSMVFQKFLPSPFLKEFIREYRVVHFAFDNNAIIPYKAYPPRPEHCLCFFPRGTEVVEFAESKKKICNLKTVVIGQQTEVTNRYPGPDFLLFLVIFRPGALFRFTAIPSTEFTNCYIDAENVFSPHKLKETNEKLAEGPNYRAMVHIVEAFLVKQATRNKKELHQIDLVTDLSFGLKKNLNMEWLAKESCLSLRQYERKFTERMGVSPKYFNKVVRFENAFRLKNKLPHLDWLTIALECGYYDYQHLVKDYKDLTLQTPTNFHLLDLSSPERTFGEADPF